MNTAGLPEYPTPWPPLRVTGRSQWIKFRDITLTLMAWAVLAWLLKDLLYLLYDFLRHPILELTTALPPDLTHLWTSLRIVIALAALLASGLLVWAMNDRRRLHTPKPMAAPPVLSVAEQADWFRVDANAVAAARNFKVTDVQFHEDGTIAALDGREASVAAIVGHGAVNQTDGVRVVSSSGPNERAARPAGSGPESES